MRFKPDVLLVRYGEIGLKGRNRPAFESALARGLQRAVAEWRNVAVRREYGRFAVDVTALSEHDVRRAAHNVQRVFGVVSISPALRRPLDLGAVEEAALALVAQVRGEGRTFKIETRRPNKQFPLNTPAMNARLGALVLERCPEMKVDVHRPDVTIHVEVRERWIYLYTASSPGPGGLPFASSGGALLLLSGGIDSPVAGWLALKRGIALQAVHFHSPPFTSERSLQKVVDLAEALGGWTPQPMPLHVVGFTRIQTEIRKAVPPSMGITVMRRMMLRIASRLAARHGLLALVTGESVGQVASQTLESMAAINEVTSMPVLRPLVAADKSEIIDLARRIETYETSILPYEDCCTLFVPDRPETKPKPDRVRAAEAKLDVDGLVEEALLETRQLVPGASVSLPVH